MLKENRVADFVDNAIKNDYSYDKSMSNGFSVAELQEALSLLLLRVESREGELKQTLASLEKRVDQRTKELTAKNCELERMATHDELTKLNNRRYFNDKLDEYSHLAVRFGHKLSCIMADIDHFKKVNDTYGHQIGDLVLASFADLLKQVVRRTDILARYGGEEFVILLPNTSVKNAADLAERIRMQLESKELRYQGVKLKITVSFGVAVGEKSPELGESLVKSSDDKLYEAKESGRNRVCY